MSATEGKKQHGVIVFDLSTIETTIGNITLGTYSVWSTGATLIALSLRGSFREGTPYRGTRGTWDIGSPRTGYEPKVHSADLRE